VPGKIFPIRINNNAVRISFNFAMSIGHVQLPLLSSGIVT
jgi:hypothetical protein